MKRIILAVGAMLLMASGFMVYNVTVRAQRQNPPPDIISGGDLGFRITGFDKSGQAKGEFVVRLKGEWVKAEEDHQVRTIPVR